MRKMNKRTKKYYVAAIIFAFLLFSVIYTAITVHDANTNYGPSILFLTIAGLACLSYVVYQIPSVKGAIGERFVSFFIKKGMAKDDVLINDVIVPGDDGKTSQIDHILVSTKGIYVIETKNISGRIYGSVNELKWMQVLNYGRVKNQFYSPIKQNQTHLYRLENIIGSVPMKNCVVFVQGNTDYIKADVYYPYLLYTTIKKAPKGQLSQTTVQEIAAKINAYKAKPIQTNKEHIEEIHQTIDKIQNNICPRCGGKLVLRQGRDGRNFYGCENYPKCKFTKKA